MEQFGEGVRSLCQLLVPHICADDYPAGIQIIVQRLGLAQKLGTEDDALAVVLLPDGGRISNRHCGLDDHDGVRVRLHDQLDHIFHIRRVEVLGNGIVICR